MFLQFQALSTPSATSQTLDMSAIPFWHSCFCCCWFLYFISAQEYAPSNAVQDGDQIF